MKTDELAERLFGSALGALDVWAVCLGDRLGLYAALRRSEPLTAAQLAATAGIHPRYAREWLEQQTVSGLLAVDDPRRAAEDRRYALPSEHADVLTNVDSLSYLTPLLRTLGAAGAQLPALEAAYRSGGGVPWNAYGEHMRRGQADGNRPWFLSVLGSRWLPEVPELDAVLTRGARVADVGCGEGWSSIGLAGAYPAVTVDGFDVDADSVREARRHAGENGVADRVRFHEGDVAEVAGDELFDVVTAFECVHDLPDPVAVLASIRRLVRPGGFVLVMDERVPDEFLADGADGADVAERLMYGFSLMICLPDGMSHPTSAATGTVMRAATLRGYATDAGFTGVEVLPIDNDLWRFYRLHL